MSLITVVPALLGIALFQPEGKSNAVVAERNPFALSTVSTCLDAVSEEENQLIGWQLGGVVGQDNDRQAWLKPPAGNWLIGQVKSTLPLRYWQLTQIESQAAVFSLKTDVLPVCRGKGSVVLKLREK